MMREKIAGYVKDVISKMAEKKALDASLLPSVLVEKPKTPEYGDYSSNVAFVLASSFGMKPYELAHTLAKELSARQEFKKVEVAGGGFINFFLKKELIFDILGEIIAKGDSYGNLDIGKGKKLQVEFVSANPTGPLHVGHGRNAVFGDALARLLKKAGYEVVKEYYLNDAGNQMRTLGKSVYLRMLELSGSIVDFPADCYQGHYIVDIAREILLSKEHHKLDGLSEGEIIDWCGRYAGEKILGEIKDDLAKCGIVFDSYYSEKSLYKSGAVQHTIDLLRKKGFVYEADGALWFKSTEFGDEKDRVLVKSSGEYTYFASDIAYHVNKFERGFTRVIDIWGADHAGHVTRIKGAMKALGYNPDNIDIILIQLVNLIRGGEVVSMSTRRATYETFGQLLDDVGKDACRYFYLSRSCNAQLDFDIELAKREGPENPAYYIQYAHARISSIFKKASEQGIIFNPNQVDLRYLSLEEEYGMARLLAEYPNVIHDAACKLEPHKVSFYLLELARMFQNYYTKAKTSKEYMVLYGEEGRVQAKLYLLKSIQIVLKNGLELLGIDAPERMERGEE